MRRVPVEAECFPVKGDHFRHQFVDTYDIREYRGRFSFADHMRRCEREYAEAVANVEDGWRAYSWYHAFGIWVENRWFNDYCRRIYAAGPPDRQREWCKYRKDNLRK